MVTPPRWWFSLDGETFEESFLKQGAGCRHTGGTGPFLGMLAVPEFTSKRSPGADGQCVVGFRRTRPRAQACLGLLARAGDCPVHTGLSNFVIYKNKEVTLGSH